MVTSWKKVVNNQRFRSPKGQVLFPIFPAKYLVGVFADPEVFLLVGYSFPENEPDWAILNESTLELDWSILLWTNYAPMTLTLPREGFENFYS